MKVHHNGFSQPQDTKMTAEHGLRHVDSAINLAELANGTGNGVFNGQFHMDVDSPPATQEFDRPQG